MTLSSQTFTENGRERLLEELSEFLRIPSVSTLPEHKNDILRAAEFVASSLRDVGMETVEVIAGEGHPLVYAESLEAPGKPTVLCYGHYDVQPPDPLDEWETPPFEPTVRNGSLYARGAADDKGQMYAHIKAIEALRAADGRLPINVKFLIEGEEEVGGKAIAAYVPAHRDRLAADVALVSDTAMYAPHTPTICTGCAGWFTWNGKRRGRPATCTQAFMGSRAQRRVRLVELLAKCKDAAGVIQIPECMRACGLPPRPRKKAGDGFPSTKRNTWPRKSARRPLQVSRITASWSGPGRAPRSKFTVSAAGSPAPAERPSFRPRRRQR